ncbi:hypothetical protein KXD93_06980 [Mucilaginibacter sp. BJC16-A38]|uniref:hypothetical protein n=1 Tax=Mucilaginibacter phenanthrenivorans TaxID=1234842 RepID=UPI00215798B8|nr:hypothetical protein [Mucilaginibacter phenanthrenivorans]MCR8557378.1 hypothetical protein [Mucilaginibacter phenanthrenivorans]
MKYIAVFLATCILLLSSVPGMANTHRGAVAYCKGSRHQDCCKQQKQTSDNDCAKGTCHMMVSCSTCGFIIIQSITVSPVMIHLKNQIAHSYLAGGLSDYQDNDWNPPKA